MVVHDLPHGLRKAWTRVVRTVATTTPRAEPFGIGRAVMVQTPARNLISVFWCDRQALPANENASLSSVVEHHTWSAEASEVLI